MNRSESANCETVYLIDGSGYIFRAFYAVTNLATKDGFPTNALFGFTRMLLSTLASARTDRVVVVFDAGRKTFRNDLYSEYKANRAECPEELLKQMPYFRDICRALGLTVLEESGYEADDIIATVVQELEKRECDVTIVTGDKDLMQLVNDRVTILDTMKQKHYRAPEVVEKFGVPPEQVVEVLALTGDSSDNVPGVDGVGPKTAAQLIQKYQTVEGVIANLDAVKSDSGVRNRAKITAAIESNLDQLRLSRKLVEVYRQVPLGMSAAEHPESFVRQPLDMGKLTELFETFEFTSLLSELPVERRPEPAGAPLTHEIVSADSFDSWIVSVSAVESFSFDVETTALDPHQSEVVGVSFCWDDERSFYIPIGHKSDDLRQVSLGHFVEAVMPVFADPKITKIGQNIKFDMQVMQKLGITVAGPLFDTMIAAYLLNPDRRSFNLTVLTQEYLRRNVIEFDEVVGELENFSHVPIDSAAKYCCQDASLAWLLHRKLLPLLEERALTKMFVEIEMPLVPVLAGMEFHGVAVDTAKLVALSSEFEAKLKDLEREIYVVAKGEFNINSPKQLGEVLFGRLGISTKGIKKTKTGISTDQVVLERLALEHPLPQFLLDYRLLHKLKSTYSDALAKQVSPVTGRIHTKLNQTGTGTGRLSSSEPNLQNIPIQSLEGKRIRSAFVAAPGNVLISADYSQIELRLLAHLSGDETMRALFASDSDIHAQTAREILNIPPLIPVSKEDRRIGKTINFGIVYGMGPFRLARDLGIPVHQASKYIENYFARFPKVKAFFSGLERSVEQNGYVETLFGRKRFVGGIDASGRDQGFVLRAALNAPLQGSAADIIKIAMIRVAEVLRSRGLPIWLVLQIHDELLFECKELPQAETSALMEELRATMEQAVSLTVPLKVEIGSGVNWQEAQGG